MPQYRKLSVRKLFNELDLYAASQSAGPWTPTPKVVASLPLGLFVFFLIALSLLGVR
jgi:hypothetical protein